MNTTSSKWVLQDRIAGGLVGLLVGDALGVPYEFHAPQDLPAGEAIDMVPPPGFRRAHVGVPPGTWSDDGAQALVLLESLLANDGLDLTHFADGMRRWLWEGHMAVNRSVFDIGAQTSTAINRLAGGIPPDRSGPADERHNGNGSLMRVLPLALWHDGGDLELVQLAMRQSLPTHGHPRSQICCALYCLWARATLADEMDAWAWAVKRLQALADKTSIDPEELALLLDPGNAERARGSGYVLDTLWSAREAVLSTDTYADCVRHAIAFGHDTDTTACVAGGIAGLRHGLAGIPQQWRQALRGQDLLQPLLAALLERRLGAVQEADGVKTSQSDPLRVDALAAGAGSIGLCFCPGKHQGGAISGTWRRDLSTDIAAIRRWGADHVVTLVEASELDALNVPDLGQQVEAAGMRWHHLPIVDTQAPDARFEQDWPQVRNQLAETLQAGGKVLIHCKGGLGRAGTVATLLLRAMEPDLPLDAAMSRVRSARDGAIETREQERYLARTGRDGEPQ